MSRYGGLSDNCPSSPLVCSPISDLSCGSWLSGEDFPCLGQRGRTGSWSHMPGKGPGGPPAPTSPSPHDGACKVPLNSPGMVLRHGFSSRRVWEPKVGLLATGLPGQSSTRSPATHQGACLNQAGWQLLPIPHIPVQRKLPLYFCSRACHRICLSHYLADFGQIPFPCLIEYGQELGVKWSHKGQNTWLPRVCPFSRSCGCLGKSRVQSENNLVLFLHFLPSVQLHLPLLPDEILGRPQSLRAHN